MQHRGAGLRRAAEDSELPRAGNPDHVLLLRSAGDVAIVYAAQANSKLAVGDIAGGGDAARLARIWTWVGFGCGLVGGIMYAIFGLAGASPHH